MEDPAILISYLQVGSVTFLRSVGIYLPDYMVSHSSRW